MATKQKGRGNMKKIIAWLLVLAMTAAISIGATLAYLTDTDEDVNVMTLGNVKIDQLEYERVDDETAGADATVQEFHDNKPLYPAVTENGFDYTPGDTNVDWTQIGKNGYTSDIWDPSKINNELDKMVFVKNKGSYDAYVRTVFAFEAGKYTTLDEFRSMVHMNLNEDDFTWAWVETPVTIGESTYFVATATYNKVLAPGALTEISLSQIALDKTATNADVEAFGDTYQILVKTQAIQADGFDDPTFALDEGFGLVAADSLPWDSDAPEQGVTMKDALHYLNGDPTGTRITPNVTSVIFGLNKDYSSITDNYDGVLLSEGQDVAVYVYYVPNGSNYDIYFLANDDIYAPESCYQIFYNGGAMSSLQTLDLGNLNTSRTTSMARMFRDLPVTTMDLSGFDTSLVTDMSYMFYSCKKLTSLNATGWDTSNVATAKCMFWPDSKLTDLTGEEGWDLSNLENAQSMFRACTALEYLDVTNWDMSKVTTFKGMFCADSQNTGAMALKELVGMENWNVQSVQTLEDTFYGCGNLKTVDMSGWNVTNLTTMSHMFADCYKLENVYFTDWETTSLTSLNGTFNNCESMKSVDMSMFDTSKVYYFSQTFEACYSLEKVIGLENWDTSLGDNFSEMFSGCNNLKQLDLSSFDTRNADHLKEGDWVFLRFITGCTGLEKITFGPYFDFDGVGCAEGYKFVMPAATGVAGWDGKWYTADGTGYLPSEIREMTAATYYAVNPVKAETPPVDSANP